MAGNSQAASHIAKLHPHMYEARLQENIVAFTDFSA